jgi:membrane peptidoglycan carboxypeptidase
MPLFQRNSSEQALAEYLGERMSAREIAEAYAAMVYFGRNCYGYQSAVQGLARTTAERADDATWLALAALPRSPSFYLRDRSALKDRVSGIIADMQSAGLVDGAEAERLKSLPLASVDIGPGCSS